MREIIIGSAVLLLCLAACKGKVDTANIPDAAPTPAPVATAIPAQTCDVNAEWFDGGSEDGRTPEENLKAFTTRWKGRTPQCRASAMHNECDKHGCDDLLPDVLIAAAGSPAESQALLQTRVDGNVAAIARGRVHYAKTKELVTYANSIRGAQRSSAFQKATSVEGMAQELADGNPCILRLKRDFARVDAASKELDGALPTLPFGSFQLRSVFISLKSCLNCADDRSGCKDATDELKATDETLAEYEAGVGRDRKTLGLGLSGAKAPR